MSEQLKAPTQPNKRPKPIKTIVAATVIVLIGLILAWKGLAGGEDQKGNPLSSFDEVRQGSLTISVLESGTIKARDQIIIKNEVEGRTSIITLIPEGTVVKKGDLLVELDASTLEDTKIDQEIRVQNAEASFINANENLAVVKNQAQSDIDKAELTLKFAEQDLDQYRQGEYPNLLSAAQSKITLADEELTRAKETLEWSEKLYREKYISETEYQADRLAHNRKSLDLHLAKNDLELLEKFTYHRQIAQLESDLHQATMALDRTQRKAKADIVQAEAELKARQAEFKRQQDKLDKIIDQIGKTKIYAPAAGLAIYATSAQRGGWRGSTEPMDEGQEVRERQELIYLPTTESALAEVDIHESNLEKVSIGLPAIITIDALPGKRFLGRIGKIAPLPDAQSMWMNPDLKVYNTEIYLENSDETLRTGMSCQAEIIVEQYENALFIPIQAVLRVKGKQTVYVKTGNATEARTVEVGMDNNRMIRIISGLQAGEQVLLTPPLKAAEADPATQDMQVSQNGHTEVDDNMKQKINQKLNQVNESRQEPPNQPTQRQPDQNQNGINSDSPSPPKGDRDARRRRFEAMTPEQRQQEIEKRRKEFEAMSPEEQEKIKQRLRQAPPQNAPESGAKPKGN